MTSQKIIKLLRMLVKHVLGLEIMAQLLSPDEVLAYNSEEEETENVLPRTPPGKRNLSSFSQPLSRHR